MSIRKAKARQKKRKGLGVARVESIEIQEQGSDGRYKGMYRQGEFVYNLEVENNHNYFANGLLVSNCHTMVTDKRLKAIQQFNPEYLYGMTATPDREDGKAKAIGFTFGDVIIDKEMKTTIPKVEVINSNVKIPVEEYPDMILNQINNTERNKLIVKTIRKELVSGRKILVLCKRIAHYKLLYGLLSDLKDKDVYCISSSEKESERLKLLEDLRGNKRNFDVLFGTYPMLATGTDIPCLDTLIFAGDLKSSVLTKQAVGRLTRIFEGKKNPKVLDFADNFNGILYNQFKGRKRFYKKQGWTIT